MVNPAADATAVFSKSRRCIKCTVAPRGPAGYNCVFNPLQRRLRPGEHTTMKLKALGIGAALTAALFTEPVDFAQQAAAPPKSATCPAEGFSGGFSRGCPQKQFANAADISAMMAALPDKPYASPQSLRHVLVLGRAVG